MGAATPLRYPGGKQKLTPFISEILHENELIGGHYAEPYCGGAGVAIQLLLDDKVSKIHLNDSFYPIYAFWRAVIEQPENFCKRIFSASLNPEEWRRQREILRRPAEFDLLDLGFSVFFLNRCNRSGILTAGMIGGNDQTGEWKIDARFPRNELIRRVEAIALKSSKIVVRNQDAEFFIKNYISKLPRKTLVYCDPPYFQKSDRLYFNHYKPKDHARIAKIIKSKLMHPWVVSYDSAPEITRHYKGCLSIRYDLQYSASKAYKGSEAFFFSKDLRVPRSSKISSIGFALKKLAKRIAR